MTSSELAIYVSSAAKTNPLHGFGRASRAASVSQRFSSQRLSSTWRRKEHCWAIAAVFTSAMLVLSCSTALVTENTLSVSTTAFATLAQSSRQHVEPQVLTGM